MTWESHYEHVWLDFLDNKRALCLQKVKKLLQDVPGDSPDDIIMHADFLYLQAVCEESSDILKKALARYEHHEKLVGPEHNNLKMQGETLLRLREYEAAFETFDRLAELHITAPLVPWENREISSAWLQHEIAQRRLDGLDVTALTEVFRCLQTAKPLADSVSQRTGRTLVQSLSAEHQQIIRDLPRRKCAIPSMPSCGVLGRHDWDQIQAQYRAEGLVVVDDLLSPVALQMLLQWSCVTPSFQTQRAGFIGAFPSNGANYRLIRTIAEELESQMPDILHNHPLGLWWLFKYAPGVGREGIGLHADPAAVNVNIWLTPDSACSSGGGLEVFSHTPPVEQCVHDYNHEFASAAEEEALVAKLKAYHWEHISYRQNRAVFFVSDRYHRSVPFEFHSNSLMDWRLNFTLLFGDRPKKQERIEMSVAPPEHEGWDLF